MFKFNILVDLPFALVILGAFLVNFRSFAYSKNVDTSVDLIAALPRANFRAIACVVLWVAACWWVNVSVWLVLAIIFFVGFVPALAIADSHSDGVLFLAPFAFLRECAFGFPTLVLRPKPERQLAKNELVGKTGKVSSALKPSGRIKIDDQELHAVSEGGEFIESGSTISITGTKNGTPTVRKIEIIE